MSPRTCSSGPGSGQGEGPLTLSLSPWRRGDGSSTIPAGWVVAGVAGILQVVLGLVPAELGIVC